MTTTKIRHVYEAGHRRKYLLIVDDSQEVEAALYFCASRIVHSSGIILFCYVVEPQEYTHWVGVRQVQIEEETNKAKALFRLFRRKLTNAGFDAVVCEEVIREGKKAEEIVKLIDEDEDIAILVLGAATDAKGPGPLVSSFGTGKLAGTFPVPIVIVPGHMTVDELRAMA